MLTLWVGILYFYTMQYDYIILGGGASGLSLAHRMALHPFFKEKKIALVEKEQKNKNDRTWCYWSKTKNMYDSIIAHSWSSIAFFSPALEKTMNIDPYRYNMIRGIDFYNYVYPILEASPNVDIIYGEVVDIQERSNEIKIRTKSGLLEADYVFKSFFEYKIDPAQHLYVDQHFKGFVIESETEIFDPEVPTFMDFRIDQEGETRFLYVLPESSKKALVEVAIFSNNLLSERQYDQILIDYIDQYITREKYTILEEEVGVIPMTTYPFQEHNTARITHIGGAGGIIKASSGYAFERIQRHSDQIIDCLVNNKSLDQSYKGLTGRHLFYDRIMLHAILRNGVEGRELFTLLFKKLTPQEVFRFLDQDSTFFQELKVFTAPPFLPFLDAFHKEVINSLGASNRD